MYSRIETPRRMERKGAAVEQIARDEVAVTSGRRSNAQETAVYDKESLRKLRQDPYVLAYRYFEYMEQHPRRRRERINPYYQNLLANKPDPDPDANDDLSRAIRYAKEHYECYYEVGDVSRIIQWLPAREAVPESPESPAASYLPIKTANGMVASSRPLRRPPVHARDRKRNSSTSSDSSSRR